jgi:UDP-GlcNAc3NAcA epimerase
MKIVTVVGARPQFIKAAPVSRALHTVGVEEVLLHTGQHYDASMSGVFFSELGMREPAYNLGVGSGSHGEQTGRMLVGIEDVITREQPEVVLVYGDTNSTLSGALAAAKLGTPVAHVEAGLRSFNMGMPEEINRLVADRLSAILFCPTQNAVANLAAEGILQGVYQVGDVMYDAVLWASDRVDGELPSSLGVEKGKYLLATVHRAGNTDVASNLGGIMSTLGRLGEPVVLPLHPRTRKALEEAGIDMPGNVRAIEPVSYLEMLSLEKHARVILTDSGGMQKEALWLGVPCVTLREETEWVETVESGWNRLAGADPERIVEAVNARRPEGVPPGLYGDGHASDRIAAILTGVEYEAEMRVS